MPEGWNSEFAPYWRVGRQIPWPEAELGMVIEAVRLEGSYPETIIVVDFVHVAVPGRRFEWTYSLWRPETLHLPEPVLGENIVIFASLRELTSLNLHRFKELPEGTVTRMGGTYSPLSQADLLELIQSGKLKLGRPGTPLVTRPDERLARE